MKKTCILVIMLILLLAGCGNRGDMSNTEATTAPETLPSYYHAQSDIEVQTNGAVMQYDLPDSQGYRWIKKIGNNILLASDSNLSQLRVLDPQRGEQVAFLQLEDEVLEICQTLPEGFAYYDSISNSVCYLDGELKQIQTVYLGTDMQTPVISPDGSEIYYCVEDEIRAYDVNNKISRLIKNHTYSQLELLGTCFDGSRIVGRFADGEGISTVYISVSNGQTMYVENEIEELTTWKDQYYAVRMDGVVRQRLFGAIESSAQQVNVPDANVFGAPEMGAVVGYDMNEAGSLVMNYYDVASGKRITSIEISGVMMPSQFFADASSGCIWLIAATAEGQQRLLRWNVDAATALNDEVVYTGPLFTASFVDSEGLKKCNERVSDLNNKYGVRIRIWEEAIKVTGNYTLEGEYQVAAIQQMLDQLEVVLDEFPTKFLQKSISSRIRICLVRSVDSEQKAVQFWEGEFAFIVLPVGADIRSDFIKGLGFVVDSHVLGNSPKFDYWDSLNPKGFVYGVGADEKYLQSENRVFADADSMQSVTLDGSRVPK